jgi:hypothetical protein
LSKEEGGGEEGRERRGRGISPERRPYPQLDGGQTRRAALIKKHRLDVRDESVAIIGEDNMEVSIFILVSLPGFEGRLIG